MSDTFTGLTRRINAFVHDRETSEELSHLIDEAADHGGDAADALIELALGDESSGSDDDEGRDLDAILEIDELTEGDEDEEDEMDEDEIDAALAELGDGLGSDSDDDSLDESTALRPGEVLVL